VPDQKKGSFLCTTLSLDLNGGLMLHLFGPLAA